MVSRRVSVGLAVALLQASGSLLAHHGTAGSYDQKKWATIKGVVKEFRWRNPHSSLHLSRRDESGAEQTYAIEMGSPNQMVKIGFTRDAMRPGDSIEIKVHPSFTNPAVGENLTPDAITINGKTVAFAAAYGNEYGSGRSSTEPAPSAATPSSSH